MPQCLKLINFRTYQPKLVSKSFVTWHFVTQMLTDRTKQIFQTQMLTDCMSNVVYRNMNHGRGKFRLIQNWSRNFLSLPWLVPHPFGDPFRNAEICAKVTTFLCKLICSKLLLTSNTENAVRGGAGGCPPRERLFFSVCRGSKGCSFLSAEVVPSSAIPIFN